MSLTAMVWAMRQKTGNPITKLILIKIADNANDQGLAWPSLNTIAEVAEIDRSTVIRHIKRLRDDLKLIEVIHRATEGINLSNHYRLLISGGSGTLPLPVSGCNKGSSVAPLGVVAERDLNHPIEPVIEPPTTSQPPVGGSAMNRAGEGVVNIDELLEAALWAEHKAGNKIRKITSWRAAVRARLINQITEDDLFVLEEWRKSKLTQEKPPTSKLQSRDPDPDGLDKCRKALTASGIRWQPTAP